MKRNALRMPMAELACKFSAVIKRWFNKVRTAELELELVELIARNRAPMRKIAAELAIDKFKLRALEIARFRFTELAIEPEILRAELIAR